MIGYYVPFRELESLVTAFTPEVTSSEHGESKDAPKKVQFEIGM